MYLGSLIPVQNVGDSMLYEYVMCGSVHPIISDVRMRRSYFRALHDQNFVFDIFSYNKFLNIYSYMFCIVVSYNLVCTPLTDL